MNAKETTDQQNSISTVPIAIENDDENIRAVVAELIDLLNDERTHENTDAIMEIVKTVHLLIKQGGRQREEIIYHPQLLIDLSRFFNLNHQSIRLFVSSFHHLSENKNGIRLLVTAGIIPILLQSIENSSSDVINFILTTLRNCLIGSPNESAEEIQRHNGCMIFISALLHRQSDRQMNFLADCLLRLALFNTTAQNYLQTSKLFLQELVSILDERNYGKLSLTLIRILPLLSSNVTTKSILIQFNLISIIERYLKTHENLKIHRYCLLTLRNLSDQIISLENFDSLIITLIEFLRSIDDFQSKIYVVDILSNLSCENQSNKSLIIQHGGISLFVDILLRSEQNDDMIESTICVLRHLTGKCHFANQTRQDDQLHSTIPYLVKFLQIKQQNWPLLKVCIGLIRNLALSEKNIPMLCENRAAYKIAQLFVKMRNFSERHELFLMTLFVFSQQNHPEYRNRIANEIVHSGCLQLIVRVNRETNQNQLPSDACFCLSFQCVFKQNLGKVSEIAAAILNALSQGEHQKMVKEAEKAIRIEEFLQKY